MFTNFCLTCSSYFLKILPRTLLRYRISDPPPGTLANCQPISFISLILYRIRKKEATVFPHCQSDCLPRTHYERYLRPALLSLACLSPALLSFALLATLACPTFCSLLAFFYAFLSNLIICSAQVAKLPLHCQIAGTLVGIALSHSLRLLRSTRFS